MPNELQCEQPKNTMQQDELEALDKLIREQVIEALGKPIDLHNVQIRKVWKNHYRVNVIVGANAGSVRVANSYFLVIDGDGNVTAATPKITKQY